MLRRSLHIAVVTLFLLATSAAAAPAELSKPPIERTAIAALWQKIVAFFLFEQAPTPTPNVHAKDQTVPPTEDQPGRRLLGDAAGWSISPNG